MSNKLLAFGALLSINLYGQFAISSWATTTGLPSADGAVGGVGCGGHLFALSNLHSYVADPGSDGQITAWRTTLPLPVTNFYPHHPICNGGYLLVVSSPNSYVGTIAPDGSITQWTPAPGTVSQAATGRSVTSNGTTIYSLGGGTSTGAIQTLVEMATFSSNGTLSAWQPLTPLPLPLPLHDSQSAVINGYLYIFGGEGSGGDTSPSRDVRRASIDAAGTIGAWELVGLLQTARPHSAYLRYGGIMHIVGGGLHSLYTNTVESVSEANLGVTAQHYSSAPLPTILGSMGTAMVGRYGYVLGGGDTTFGTHSTNAVRFTEFPASATATDTAYQVRYLSNLNLGDSFINITNTGAGGAGLAAGTTANTTGAFCANIYAFSPDEQMVSCCSCPVTPNGLVSLSARNDLISNTLTPAVPNALVIKLLATVPIGGSCVGSSVSGSATNLAPGIAAWATTVHVIDSGAVAVAETPFLAGTLSTGGSMAGVGELVRLTQLCTFINANGSGFGLCRSCRLGGFGSGRL